MPTIAVTTEIAAPVETVFDLSLSIDLHVESTSLTNETAVAGRTTGLIELGETVTWEATHFFVRQQLTVCIKQYDRPRHFRDTMVDGIFSRFDHDHHFEPCGIGTDSRNAKTQNTEYLLHRSPIRTAIHLPLVHRKKYQRAQARRAW